MKTFVLTLFTFLTFTISSNLFAQNVAINSTGSNPDTSAMLDVSSTTKGFLLPRLTTTEQDAIILPATGLTIFNTTVNSIGVNTGTPASPVWAYLGTGTGSVNSVSVASANGFTGTVATSTTTPAITLRTSVSGMIKGNGASLLSATPGSDYSRGTAVNATGIVKSASGTGNLTTAVAADFPILNQNTTGNSATVTTNANLTGNVTSVGNATTIANGVVSNAMLETMPTMTIKGNTTAGTAAPVDLNVTQVTAMLDPFTSTLKGLVPLSGGGTSNFLRADGTWQPLSGAGTNTGDVAIGTANGLSLAGQVLSLDLASTSTTGALSSTDWNTFNSKGVGSVTSVSIVSANGVSGTVATATTTPSITLTLGAITPTSVAATGTVTGSNLSGTNTGDETLATIKSKLGITTLSGSNTGDQTITLTGDVTGTGTGSFPVTISPNVVTYSKMQAVSTTNKLLGSSSTATPVQEITLGSGLNLTGTTLTAAGSGGTVTSASVTTANGISGSVANATTTPAITLTLGAITPTSIAATGAITGSNLSGTNTGNVTIGTANGLSLAGQVLSLGLASTSTTGALSSTDWNTFNNKASAFTQGNLTETGSGVLTITGGTGSVIGAGTTVQVKQAATAQNGFLSSTDWNTFNNKQPQLNGTGFVKASGTTISYDNTTYLTGNQTISFAPTGDVTGSTTGTTTIAPALVIGTNKVLNTMLAQMPTLTIKGNNTGGTANALDLTAAQVNAILPVFTSTLNGLVPLSGGSAGKILHGDGTWKDTTASTNQWSITGNSGTSYLTNFLGTTDNKSLRFRANNVEGVILDSLGNLGVGTTTPAYKLHVAASSNPLFLAGVQTGASTDSLLTIINGVVKKLSPSALTISSSNAWALVGNAGTSATANFVGTTDSKSVRFRSNNVLRMIIDSSLGNVGIGTTAFDASVPEKLLVNAGTNAVNGVQTPLTPINAIGFTNGYEQIQVQNRAWGQYSSSDLVAASDGTRAGTVPFNTDTHYVDLGVNSSGYSNNNSNILNQPFTSYLYASSPETFLIGNGYSGKDIVFFTNYGPTNGSSTADGFELMRLKAGTNLATQQVTIGIIAPNGTNKLTVNGSISATAFNVSSDRRLKTNIKNLQYGLKEVLALEPVSYNWKKTPAVDKQLGLIAQDAKKTIPEIVSGNEKTGTLSINYTELVPVLINAIKEQQQQIDELKKDIQLLKNKK